MRPAFAALFGQGQTFRGGPCTSEGPQWPICAQGPGPLVRPCTNPLDIRSRLGLPFLDFSAIWSIHFLVVELLDGEFDFYGEIVDAQNVRDGPVHMSA